MLLSLGFWLCLIGGAATLANLWFWRKLKKISMVEALAIVRSGFDESVVLESMDLEIVVPTTVDERYNAFTRSLDDLKIFFGGES